MAIKRILFAFLVTVFCASSALSVSAAADDTIQPFSYREELPVQYEVWYSYAYHEEERNFVYRTFTYPNGFNRTDSLKGNLELTPLQYEFYKYAQVWEVNYNFY